MALPVTSYTPENVSTTSLYAKRYGYKQARPIDRPLSYAHTKCRMIANSGGDGSWGSTLALGTLAESYWRADVESYFNTHLRNKLYSKLRDKVYSQASLGVSLAEFGQSSRMIIARAGQLFEFGKALRRFDFIKAARILKMSTVPKRVGAKKSFANNYLEFHFGWSPLIGDIYDAIDVFNSPVDDFFPVVQESIIVPAKVLKPVASGGYYDRMTIGASKIKSRAGCKVRINNPNLHLANQLGLTNPALIAYELIPFSFVANWFVSVEEFLSQGTDYLGLTVTDGWYSRGGERWYLQEKGNPFWSPPNAWKMSRASCLYRDLGMISPILQVRPFKIWGWRRAAAAVSLVVQQLGRR